MESKELSSSLVPHSFSNTCIGGSTQNRSLFGLHDPIHTCKSRAPPCMLQSQSVLCGVASDGRGSTAMMQCMFVLGYVARAVTQCRPGMVLNALQPCMWYEGQP